MISLEKELAGIFTDAGSPNQAVAINAQEVIAKALQLPLRDGIESGDILDGIFEGQDFTNGQPIEYPLSFYAPGAERDHVAYAIPNQGRIAEKHVEGDYVQLPTYDIGSSIDTLLKYMKNARWDVASRMAQVLEAGFVKKINDDGYHVLLSAAVDRNILVYDSDAVAGQFTKRLVSLMKTVMRRNGGGNSTSVRRSALTDLYVSPEAVEDILNWNVDQIDEVTRREVFLGDDNGLSRIFSVNMHTLDELGVGQEYQLFYTSDLSGVMGASDEEVVIGLDLRNRNSLVMPVRNRIEIFPDPMLHRQRRVGWYGWTEIGFGCLDNRVTLVGSF